MPGVDIRRDDTVRVMAGKSRGHTGRVIRVDPRGGRGPRLGRRGGQAGSGAVIV